MTVATNDDQRPTNDERQVRTRAARCSSLISRWSVVGILALALALRLLLWSQPLHEPANDEVEYIAVAQDLLAGRGWSFYDSYRWLRAPLYPLFLAGSLWLAGGDLHRAALPNIALSVANVYLAYRLALALVGRRAAALAALITALLWTLVTFASLYMAETLFTFLFQAGLLCALRAGGRRPGIGDQGLRSDDQRTTTDERGIAATHAMRWAAAAGVLLGLATLTRSITLLFLPIVALWLAVHASCNRQNTRQIAALLFVFLFACCAVIAPWTARNYLAYNEPILVETGLAYNLWRFNEPRERESEIHRALEQIRSPAERADYATARGLARLREDPMILARKVWPNWVFLARVKPIQDRFLLESYYATVELPLFAAALVFDDLLYVVIGLAAIAGLVRRRAPWLVYAWLGYAILTVLLTHGEARYRQFLFPVLVPYAAWALSNVQRSALHVRCLASWAARHAHRSILNLQRLMIAGLWAIFLWTVLTSYPWDWAGWNLARGWHTLAGDVRWAAGDHTGALRSYGWAIEAHDVPDAWLRLGHARRAAGDLAGAAEAYRRGWRREPLYYPASTWYGDALRELGDEEGARRAFAGSFADPARVTAYAWRALRPAPRAALDVGGGLDFGYVGGVYPAEEIAGASARWSGGRALLRLVAPRAGPAVLRLRLAAPRPGGTPGRAQVCASGACRDVALGASWRIYTLPLAAADGGALVVELRSDTFRAPDGRELGVLIDWVGMER
ncbi:MAG TPA: glycosyltransferase family 39 protein [Roseiflexaceae bacterium]|nr:glycosyltransferase family 39 protein [Roseiflexaceae bacterium]